MTQLESIKDAFSVVWVATYEPLIVEWVSGLGIRGLRGDLHVRAALRRSDAETRPDGGPLAGTLARFNWRVGGRGVTGDPRHLAAARPDSRSRAAAAVSRVSRALPGDARVSGSAMQAAETPEIVARRRKLDQILSAPDLTITSLLTALEAADLPVLTGSAFHQALSPVGVAHLYRQLFFDADAGVGPIEQVFAIAPKEVLEVVQEMTRRSSREMVEQFGSETTHENQIEQTNLDEISDQVQSSVTRDMSVGVSASAEGSVGVWSASATANVELGVSTSQSRDLTKHRLQSITRKSAEVIRKTYSLSIRTFSEFTQRSTMKRVITNDLDTPVNYALRRVMQKVRVKVQSIGPRLVWQLYVCRPGEGLAQSRLVMFREADPVSPPGLPPNAPPKPQGGSESGTQTVDIVRPSPLAPLGTVTITVAADPAREITAMVIDSIVDSQPEGKDPSPPGITPDTYQRTLDPPPPATPERVHFLFSVSPGSAQSATVGYTIHFEPSADVIKIWNDQVAAARAVYEEAKLEAQFERAKRVIEAKSQVPARPASDLRDEERYEILNRMISEAFRVAPTSGLPTPVEIELFHRYFDISAMFYYVHPSWWRPRYGVAAGGFRREAYEITEDSEPAAFGKSLGWLIQLDGDRRRNEFLNSPWIRVCAPIRPGLEREACAWLAKHIEGERGFNLAVAGAVGKLIADIEARRGEEQAATPGPDYVTLDGQVAPSATSAADAYPVIDEFDVVVPTEGFVFEPVTVAGP